MQCFIIEGDNASREKFIDQFKKNHKIKEYNIQQFSEKFQIEDARALKSFLSVKLSIKEKRLVLISIVPTIEAQNALLKTIEEIKDDTFLIFSLSSKNQLLPTVISRCFISTLGVFDEVSKLNPKILENLIDSIKSQNFSGFLGSLDYIFLEKKEHVLDELIPELRKKLINISLDRQNSQSEIYYLLHFLKYLVMLHPLAAKNNLNSRLVLENAYLNLTEKIPLDKKFLL